MPTASYKGSKSMSYLQNPHPSNMLGYSKIIIPLVTLMSYGSLLVSSNVVRGMYGLYIYDER